MQWNDYEYYIEIFPPKEFSFAECLLFLDRSNLEVLHQIKEDAVYKVIQGVVCTVTYVNPCIQVKFVSENPPAIVRQNVAQYIWEWFDLESDLHDFYQLASQDDVLKPLVDSYYGLRIIGIPDLFEALVWAIVGQQINLTFAYTLKKRFIEQFGECVIFEGEAFWMFPTVEKIAGLSVEDLKCLQFTTRKAEYIIFIAQEMMCGSLSKEQLLETQDIQKSLVSIRGIGTWTANYVMLRCLHQSTAFPITDVGLHNALKVLLNLEEKPTIHEIETYAVNWQGWQAYATFYLWRSLYGKNI
ncbi:DNA-3-methyladenine glycosylase family protein [Lysinibacillus piscis]|uniref:DNA-3-methyladenine glycosylase II n=1 Tax=Lysinibacillus piscis TaxID=2518931 RepID=A0ABQ5NPL9_9BACI|nr:DNA-3-methyladenine glycosylase 2 [Lysinibacillus sp. KH24]GLC90051.1 DNA-3-methyladenine glycosylase [Lysinibacillus sp. KH24]